MKSYALLFALLLSITFSACQCSNKPDIGPVEGEDTALPAHVR